MSTEEVSLAQAPTATSRISLVGIGGAGNNLLARAIVSGVSPIRCVAVNTDGAQLSGSPARNKVLMNTPSASQNKDSSEETSKFSLGVSANRVKPFVDGSNFAFVLTGLGGVLGTSTAPLIAQLTRSPECLVVSIVALPYLHERERRFVALRGLKQMARASNCTVIVDNATSNESPSTTGRISDEQAGIAVRSLAEFVSTASPMTGREVLEVMSLGPIATVCTAAFKSGRNIQSSVVEALRKPSASLPLKDVKGAILLSNGSRRVENGEAALAYETIASLVGENIEFIHGNVRSASEPTMCLFLTGYDYNLAIRSLVDFVELYDAEAGEPSTVGKLRLEVPLFQMEVP